MSHPTNQIADESRGTVEVTENERHRLLAAKRRRIALEILSEELSTFELQELSRAVAAREEDYDETDESDVEEIAVTLHHAHLPMMDEFGIIAYDRRQQQIAPTRAVIAL